jgi:hypothetical protein
MVLLSGLVVAAVVAEIDRIIRPVDDRGLDFLARRYSYLRQFIPAVPRYRIGTLVG